MLLRRQLASERPRRRPWIRLGAASTRRPVWRRGWQSFLRWPLGRVVRVLAIAVAAGAATAAAWSGITLLFVLPGLLLMVAALDLVEPLAQETDHPTRRELLPLPAAGLIQRHLVPSFAAMAACAGVGDAGGAGTRRPSASTAGVGIAMLFPTALVLVCCAALSATNDPYAYVLNPSLGYVQSAAPIVIAVVAAGGPVLAAREAARHGGSATSAAVSLEFGLLLIGVAMAWWLGKRMSDETAVAS